MERHSGAANKPLFKGRRAPRGPKRFAYTYETIAELVRRPVATVKGHAQKRCGRLDPNDLRSTSMYIAAAAGWMQLSIEEQRLIEALRAGRANG